VDLPPFAVTFDYRCPFARTGHEHLVLALQAGAPWDVTFVPFSLDQPHTEEGQPDAWDDPARVPGNNATLVGLAVRDTQPERFLAAHLALFTARHEHRLDVRDLPAVVKVAAEAGADADAVLAELDSGRPLHTLADEHKAWVASHEVFGVPTFIVGDDAVFVRLMERPNGDVELARTTIERVVSTLVDWPSLNEFKHTRISR
jgi:protein-disulfide isomerase